MKIVVNDKGVFVDGEKVSDRSTDSGVHVVSESGGTSRVVVNDRDVTGFWGGCIAFVGVAFGLLVAGLTLLGVALMFAAPFLALIGLGWLFASISN